MVMSFRPKDKKPVLGLPLRHNQIKIATLQLVVTFFKSFFFLSCKHSLGGSFLLDRVSHHPMLSTFNITIAPLEGGEEPKTLVKTRHGNSLWFNVELVGNGVYGETFKISPIFLIQVFVDMHLPC